MNYYEEDIITCPKCKGKGWFWMDDGTRFFKVICDKCDGNGVIKIDYRDYFGDTK